VQILLVVAIVQILLVVAIIAVALAWAIGWKLGGNARERAVSDRLAAFARALKGQSGQDELAGLSGSPELADVRAALEEGEEAVRTALERLSAFLQVAVEGPLNRALSSGGSTLRDGVEDALGAIDDLEFFLEEPQEGSGPTDVRDSVRRVVRDFVGSWDVPVRERLPDRPVRARMNPDAFMDAVFLILHNAARFGDGRPIDVTLAQEGHEVLVHVRDQGPGFSAEALLRALDPFYSTAPGGLGMGLPHARRLIEGQGGVLRFRNLEAGGAEVTVAFPKL
jgi:signal transduction histidine kinase